MMLRYVTNRLLQLILILIGVSIVVFLMLRLIPGDPAQLLLGEFATAQELAALREKLGLDQSQLTQYWIFLKNSAQGDFGKSLRTGAPVVDEIFGRLMATVELALAAMLIATLFGIFAGVISAVRQYSLWDYGSMLLALIGVSMPIFWLGLMLMYLFSVKWAILPMMGRLSMGLDAPRITGLIMLDALLVGKIGVFWNAFTHLLLPSFTLSTVPMAIVARMTRSSMLEVLRQDYVRTARAKGMSEFVVIVRHALRNAFLPIVTVLGINLGLLLGGAVLTETIFSWPGLGRYVVDSLMGRDYNAVQACILIFAVIMALINLIVDLIYVVLDPRIRVSE
ncbi:binding-protein-dependent transport systems inner membrane component [Candidatus Vecturithrix granuli]|uniref:Binding-protein-dependent transport systems inner membrane component n=1 Tax=Vecturithrix granuli TaxID=1499967 RepID=A0A081C0N7_VECG1|nr:binding-protein-dependent transport systems inner membrane component [Candidatus Vecturithrix granuli]